MPKTGFRVHLATLLGEKYTQRFRSFLVLFFQLREALNPAEQWTNLVPSRAIKGHYSILLLCACLLPAAMQGDVWHHLALCGWKHAAMRLQSYMACVGWLCNPLGKHVHVSTHIQTHFSHSVILVKQYLQSYIQTFQTLSTLRNSYWRDEELQNFTRAGCKI